MRVISSLLLLFTGVSIFAQEGFIQAYDFEEGGLAFKNSLLVEDTIVLFGNARHPSLPQWGVYFAKLDTMGSILDYRVHYDSIGHSFLIEQGTEMIKTYDNGYAMVGQMFGREAAVLIRLDENGNLKYIGEYPDESVLNIQHWSIIETAQGFISTGVKQQADDGYWDAFVMGTNQQGEKQWEFSYGEYGTWERLPGIRKINENEFLLSGSGGNSSLEVADFADLWVKSIAVKIDTLGQIITEWEGEQVAGNGSIPVLNKLYSASNGNWVNEGAVTTLLGVDNLAYQGEIVKRDTNFNVIWQTAFGEPTSWFNNFIDLAPGPDGGWVAAGQYIEPLPMGDRINAAMIAKVNANGDSLWSRVDTLFSHETTDSDAYLSGVVVLPSGSIIACGHVNKFSPDPAQSYGWIIKVDKDGCMEPGCNEVVNSTNLTPLLTDFEVYPNPVQDDLTIRGDGIFDFQITNLNGQILIARNEVSASYEVNLKDYPSGSYYLRIKKGNAYLTKKILKL